MRGKNIRNLFGEIFNEIARILSFAGVTTKDVEILHFGTVGKISLDKKSKANQIFPRRTRRFTATQFNGALRSIVRRAVS